MGDKEGILCAKWVVLVKMGMSEEVVLKRRPDLTAGGGVSRATLRQGETRECAPRFARERSRAKLLMCKANEHFFSTSGRCTRSAISAISSASLGLPAVLDGVDFLEWLVFFFLRQVALFDRMN